jgi:hypothetical protein
MIGPDATVSESAQYLYVLKDPRTSEVRYVGKTPTPEKRARQHRCPNSSGNLGLMMWKQELKALGLVPTFEVICTILSPNWLVACGAVSAAEKAEIRWWSNHNALRGHAPLLNIEHNHPRKAMRRVTYQGRTRSIAAWARDLGISRERLRQRLNAYDR